MCSGINSSDEDGKPPVESLTSTDGKQDPVEYCNHIQREVKKARQRVALQKIESEMSSEQRHREREIQRQQLENIFKLMEDQKERFGVGSVDDVQEQMKLYIQWPYSIRIELPIFWVAR